MHFVWIIQLLSVDDLLAYAAKVQKNFLILRSKISQDEENPFIVGLGSDDGGLWPKRR